MFRLDILDNYTRTKEALNAVETVRRCYKGLWAEADEIKDNNAMDEIDTHLSELDVMQVELESVLKDYKEFLEQ